MTGMLVRTLKVREDSILYLAVLANGNFATHVENGELEIWESMTGALVTKISEDIYHFIEVDGKFVTLRYIDETNEKKILEIWDQTTGTLISTFPFEKEDCVLQLEFFCQM